MPFDRIFLDELSARNGLFARMWQEYQASVQWKVAKEG